MKPKAWQSIRGDDIAMIFQDPMTSLNPYLTVERQMTEVLQAHLGMSRKDARARAIHTLEMVEIPEAKKRFFAYPHELSGGMRQRVVIAMALLCNPKILLADEPTTALDVTVQSQILELIRRLRSEIDAAVILITHNLGVVANACDKVAVMYGGRFVETGPLETVFKDPTHPYTQGLLNSMPRMHQAKGHLESIPGNPPNLQRLPKGCAFYERCAVRIDRCQNSVPPLVANENNETVSACFVRHPD